MYLGHLMTKQRKDIATRFKSAGRGAAADETKPVTIRLPLDVIDALSKVPEGRQQYIRRVVRDALTADGFLDTEKPTFTEVGLA